MCGIIGIYLKDNTATSATHLATLGLFAEQHRGQESCGIAASNSKKIQLHKGMGLVKNVFTDQKRESMDGKIAIGHVRYPTKGSSTADNAQPHLLNTLSGPSLALSSNGDIENYKELRTELEQKGVFFESGNDGELILKYIAYWHIRKGFSIVDSIHRLMHHFIGSYSTVLLTRDKIYAFRDPYGVRPMIIGKLENDEGMVFASETCALSTLHGTYLRSMRPAEIVIADHQGLTSIDYDPDSIRKKSREAHCIFELIYFSRPDSIVYNHPVHAFREKLGKKLAENETIVPDVVVPVPDSSNFIAMGYAQAMHIPFNFGLIRNHYVGRTFIAPDQTIRDEAVFQKFNVLPGYFEGKTVTLVDDSIVRGTTLRKLVRMLKDNGAKQVHIRIGSPMVKYPCFYGIDTPTQEELIANKKSVNEICNYLRADSLRYLSIEELATLIDDDYNFCKACFDGKYPIELQDNVHEETDK